MSGNFSFEESYKRLEEILEKMNGKTVSLEESLALYEEADKLIKQCTEKLDSAEQKIQMMIKNREGNLELNENGTPKVCNFDQVQDQILTRKE